MTPKSLHAIAKLITNLQEQRNAPTAGGPGLAPEVTSQLDAIENLLYGLLDRYAFCHLSQKGKMIYSNRRSHNAFMRAVETVRANEGERGNSDDFWFNILTHYPEGTLDGVLKTEKQFAATSKDN